MDYFLKRHTLSQTITVYGANILLSFHFALIIYFNSTFLESFFEDSFIGLLYAGGSLLSIIIFFLIPRIINHLSIFTTTLVCVLIEFGAIVTLSISQSTQTIAIAFLIHTAIIAILFYILDIYLETITKTETVTGSTRGIYLTLTNLMFVSAPLVVGLLIGVYGQSFIYLLSALFLIPLTFLSAYWLKSIRVPQHTFKKQTVLADIRAIWSQPKIFYPFCAQMVLQTFFAFAVVYIPIYLITDIGFTWEILGPIFTVMLLPYILFELPVGRLADTRYGEKEFMIAGLILIAGSLIAMTFPTTPHIVLWTVLLFISRIGGSFTEITSETNFFRSVSGKDKGVIALFRMARPLSYIFATLISALALAFVSFHTLFLIMAGITLLGAVILIPMKDSR